MAENLERKKTNSELITMCVFLLFKVMFQGLTGDVKFTKARYRNITMMNANEVNRAKKRKVSELEKHYSLLSY